MSDNAQLPWMQPGWFEQVSAWIHMELDQQDIRVSGEILQPHVSPWSTVLYVPTTRSVLYFKATAPALSHEAALTQALSHWRPDCMPGDSWHTIQNVVGCCCMTKAKCSTALCNPQRISSIGSMCCRFTPGCRLRCLPNKTNCWHWARSTGAWHCCQKSSSAFGGQRSAVH